jgi:L-aminopeptidase/D-esterase-like protein
MEVGDIGSGVRSPRSTTGRRGGSGHGFASLISGACGKKEAATIGVLVVAKVLARSVYAIRNERTGVVCVHLKLA